MACKGPQPFFLFPMCLLYVDESDDTSLEGSGHLLLGAAALFEGKWRWLKSDLDGLLERFFPNPASRPSEVHCTDLRRGKGLYSHLGTQQRAELFTELCALVQDFNESEVALFAVVYDKAWWFARHPGASGDDLYLVAFENLVSRFDLLLKRRHSEGQTSKGLIIEYADPSLATSLCYCFDREPLTSNTKPGEWHGVRCHGASPTVRQRFKNIWRAAV